MKRQKKVLIRIIFLLAVFFCSGISVYSTINTQQANVMLTSDTNKEENTSASDIDFFDDEQINQILDFFPGSDFVFQICIPQKCILNSNYYTLIWQPPKNK